MIWKGWLERLIEIKREDRFPAQEERDWDWLERLKPLGESSSAKATSMRCRPSDAGEDIDPIAELRRLLAEDKKPTEEDK